MLRAALLATALLLAATRAPAADCRADFDASGSVEINELIQAVNEALNGCGGPAVTPTGRPRTATPTPTEPPADSCPYRFNQAVGADRFCNYDGGATAPPCVEPFAAGAGWVTSGMDVLALMIDEFGTAVAVQARRTGPTAAKVNSIALGPDFDNPVSATGNLALPSGSRFTATFKTATGCTVAFDGDFIGVLVDNAQRVRARAGLQQALGAHDEATATVQSAEAPARAMQSAIARQALRRFLDHRR
ncbi:MAG: hypothetical protein SF182_13410 [Deltaproteobacteria bacterium]|nr:hypothetical protein [Deltaproteobacteria bacterium]